MLNRSRFSQKAPTVAIPHTRSALPTPEPLAPPASLRLLIDMPPEKGAIQIQVGDTVRAGQRITPIEGAGAYGIAPAAGTVAEVTCRVGDYGREFVEVVLDPGDPTEAVEPFDNTAEPSLDILLANVNAVAGAPALERLADPDRPIRTLVVSGVDADYLVATNRAAVTDNPDALAKGIAVLKAATGITDMRLALSQDTIQNIGSLGITPMAVPSAYPYGMPKLIMATALDTEVPAGQSCEDMGVAFINAEAVVAIGQAYLHGSVPASKLVTVILKSNRRHLVQVPMGTPVGHILSSFDTTIEEGDRVIRGGPMTGTALYDLSEPVTQETDALVVQDNRNLALSSDAPCINCGECVRACPARIQVNMLVRFLEAGQYQTAADEYDLFSCVDCGLCSYVCVAQIPILQYIRLAKHELDRLLAAEGADV